MASWEAVPCDRSYGVAIHNYLEVGEHRMMLTVGECVRMLRECADWFYGYSGKRKSTLGIFPRSFVHVMDPSFKDTTGGNCVYGNQPYIVSEITSVLREWGSIWKGLYASHNPRFKTIEQKMYELITLRSKILSGALPVDELKEIKRVATWNIDFGNKLLGLDMVVRDEQGNILNPDNTSTIELFRRHETATKRILSPLDSEMGYQMISHSMNYTFFLAVRNFKNKFADDFELLFTLYDQRLGKPFSENFVVRWSRDSFPDDNTKFHNFKALFTDLGSRDLSREKVYLVCYVIRIGAMEIEQNSKFHRCGNSDGSNTVRRPYGVAVYNLSQYFSGQLDSDEDKVYNIPLLPCEKDTLEGTLKRCLSLKEISIKESKGQELAISFKLLNADLKQIREKMPHLVFGSVALARKMGFPEVILPGDVRNDLYLTLVSGEFSKGNKSSDKNIQVVVTICNEKGVPLQGGIVLGGGVELQTEYHSVVYYHEDKPRWNDTFKVVVPIEDFVGCHLKFLFRHRSSKNDSKDKNEKPFALSFVRLMQQNGTTLRDEQHELLVYKVDQKKYEPTDISYLELASTKTEITDGFKTDSNGLTLCVKDNFVIETNVCSTKLTQNVDLLGLLNWTSDRSRVTDNLSALMKVGGEEIIKFLQDVLDALFNILMIDSDSELHDDMVFNCLLYVIGLVQDKFQHFQSVLDLYIEQSFSATLAYNKLIIVLRHNINNVASAGKDQMYSMMKELKYIIRFITRSRFLFAQLYDGKGQQQFESSLAGLLESIAAMMQHDTANTLLAQAACLKYLPATIPDILTVFNPITLSSLLMKLINNMPATRLTDRKMMIIDDIVHSPLFLIYDCRSVMLTPILNLVKTLLETSDQVKSAVERRRIRKTKSMAKIAKVLGPTNLNLQPAIEQDISKWELCVKVLSDIMDLLFKPESGSSVNDIKEISLIILRTVIQTTIGMDRESPHVGSVASVMISIFRQMTSYHFDMYINHFATSSDLLDFLMEILLVFKDLISRPVFPTDWCEMILLQNNVILKALRSFSHTIRDRFYIEFEHQVWNNFFHCSVSFLTQPALQLEQFSQSKRLQILSRYKDMRRIAGFEIRVMWFNLGQNKKHFIPSLVSPFLEMTLVPEEELRKTTIPIFFDMMQTEFYSNVDGPTNGCTSIKGNFSDFEAEMITKLDNLVEGGSGDEQYKNLLNSIMMNLSENHSVMKEEGIRFVSTITRLMERLLEYRCIINDENKENRMICIVNLLDFYNEINRKEMYIRYVNKLCALHLECENYTEAAYTLRLHSKLLEWSDRPLSPLLKSPKFQHCETHRQLKEALYQDIIAYFDKGKMWERAVYVCKELVRQYEEETFDYCQLSSLLKRMSLFYDYIVKQLRPKAEYFRVGYYGNGFPSFLRNKVFIHRGKEYDRLSDFTSRMMNQYPNAELMNTLNPPPDDILESSGQFLQINHVEPIMDERKQVLLSKQINEQILRYHKDNVVQKFQYSRKIHRRDLEFQETNEFANLWLERTVLEISSPLPGILKLFPVVSSITHLISPLEAAKENMVESNKKLREMVIAYNNDSSLPLNPLAMTLNGIVDAAVNGGVNNYEKAFFTDEYLERHPDDADLINVLKNLIASQIPILELGIQIHGDRASSLLEPLQRKIEKQFAEMKARIEEKYGKKECDLFRTTGIRLRRHTTVGGYVNNTDNRLSQLSASSTERRSKRSFVGLTNSFSSTPMLNRSQTPSKLMSSPSLSSSIATFAGPVLSNCNVSGHKFGTISSFTRREKKKEKKRRQRMDGTGSPERRSCDASVPAGNSQWYTMPDLDSISISSGRDQGSITSEPKTPAKSEVDFDINSSSRPSSDSSSNMFDLSAVTSVDNRDSFGTTTDSTSEEDRAPPPLPIKQRADDTARQSRDSGDSLLHTIFDKEEFDVHADLTDEQPPTPPPKKPINRFNHTAV